jgi:hypothetical protein
MLREIPKNPSSPQESSSDLSRLLKERLPSFFELVSDNCRPCLNDLVRYAQVCHLLADANDYEGFVHMGDKLLDQGRAFAQFLKLLKKPSILSNEKADQLEN